MTAAQDLFTFAAGNAPLASAPAPRQRPALPIGTVQWERLVASAAPRQTILLVSALWTRQVLQVLSCPSLGRRMLMRDGTIVDLPGDTHHGLTIHMDTAAARQLHQRHGLVVVGMPGTHSARFRLADMPGPNAEVTAVLAAIATREAELADGGGP